MTIGISVVDFSAIPSRRLAEVSARRVLSSLDPRGEWASARVNSKLFLLEDRL